MQPQGHDDGIGLDRLRVHLHQFGVLVHGCTVGLAICTA